MFVIIGAVLALIFVTIVHELGHLVAAWLTRIPVARINLGFGPVIRQSSIAKDTLLVVRALPFGMSVAVPGRREPDGQLRRPVRDDLIMAAGGPVASFILAAALVIAAVISEPNSLWFTVFLATGLLSAFVALLNLIPIPGLDGGHLLILFVARFGWQLSPQKELRVHHIGIQVMIALVLIQVVVSGLYNLST